MAAGDEGPVGLAVLGAGLIGQRHIEHVVREGCAELVAIVDPAEQGRALAAELGTRWFPSFADMLREQRPDGVIIATPNRLHVENGLEAVAAGIPALVEKPLADEVEEAERLVAAAEAAGVPLLTGHHRRHNPLVQAAREAIASGRLGQLVAVHATSWFHKPAAYFEVAWRGQKGAGPVLINLIHDVDLLRYFCGEVVEVQAIESNARRGHEVEDSAVVLFRFAGGVLSTLSVSDTVAAPWSWELTSGENPAYMQTEESCYLIGGTHASLTVPHLDLWRHAGPPSWWEPIQRERLTVQQEDPLALQVRNLCAVVRGTAAPVVSGSEGLQTLRVVDAIKRAAATGQPVRLQ